MIVRKAIGKYGSQLWFRGGKSAVEAFKLVDLETARCRLVAAHKQSRRIEPKFVQFPICSLTNRVQKTKDVMKAYQEM